MLEPKGNNQSLLQQFPICFFSIILNIEFYTLPILLLKNSISADSQDLKSLSLQNNFWHIKKHANNDP